MALLSGRTMPRARIDRQAQAEQQRDAQDSINQHFARWRSERAFLRPNPSRRRCESRPVLSPASKACSTSGRVSARYDLRGFSRLTSSPRRLRAPCPPTLCSARSVSRIVCRRLWASFVFDVEPGQLFDGLFDVAANLIESSRVCRDDPPRRRAGIPRCVRHAAAHVGPQAVRQRDGVPVFGRELLDRLVEMAQLPLRQTPR